MYTHPTLAKLQTKLTGVLISP